MTTVTEKVDRLETALTDFVTSVGVEFNKLYNSQMRTEVELRAFKDEMRDFKDEMRDFKDEMGDFKDEMGEFKDEMRAFKDETREINREMNRKWGEMANKLGTIVEDLVYPSMERIVRETLGREVIDLTVRHKRRGADGWMKEFDAVAVTSDLVCLNSTKSTLRSSDVDAFVKDIDAFRQLFPEYRTLPVVGLLASLSVEESVLNDSEKRGFLVAAVGDKLMEIKNHPGFEPKYWH